MQIQALTRALVQAENMVAGAALNPDTAQAPALAPDQVSAQQRQQLEALVHRLNEALGTDDGKAA